MAYTQENRLIAIDTPLGKDVLLLAGFQGTEGLSRLFGFELDMLSENHSIQFEAIVGKSVTISVVLADEDKRYFNGIISRFSHSGGGGETGEDPRFTRYRATMVPWLWLLTRTADSRIFQKLSVPDIVEKIFRGKGFSEFKVKLQGSYKPREYCVQYRETDFNFVSRLLEEEGIHYFFEHADGTHTLILADSPDENRACPKQRTAQYHVVTGGWREEDVITALEKQQEIRPGKYALSDYNFEMPKADLKVNVPSKQKLGPGEREIHDYPGSYAKKAEGDRLARIRMEEEEAQITTITGSSNCRAFTSGYRFSLSGFYRHEMNNKDYVLTAVQHAGSQSFAGDSEFSYANHFTCIPSDVPYRPPRATPRALVQGPQTAVVVGPRAEKIFTDEYGRVKVQFFWDREGKRDENSSCWIRVSQNWAGTPLRDKPVQWGGMHIPHVGDEVIVEFLEGDPDRPLITGRVYNAANMPPLPLPKNKYKSIIRDDYGNELVFDATPGDEHIRLLSPHHKSGITLGRSAIRHTGSDMAEVVFGLRFETCIGSKITGNLGAILNCAAGMTGDVKVGSDWNVLYGGSHTLGFGYRWDWSKFPEVKHTQKDFLNTANEDYIIAAGDQLCLVGGAKKKDQQSVDRSVLSLWRDRATISVGGEVQYLDKDGNPRRDQPGDMLYNPLSEDEEIEQGIQALLLATTLAVTGPLLFQDGEERLNSISSYVGGGVALLVSGIMIMLSKRMMEHFEDERIEPVEHKDPAAKIEMDRNGRVHIYTKNNSIVIEAPEDKIHVGSNAVFDSPNKLISMTGVRFKVNEAIEILR